MYTKKHLNTVIKFANKLHLDVFLNYTNEFRGKKNRENVFTQFFFTTFVYNSKLTPRLEHKFFIL